MIWFHENEKRTDTHLVKCPSIKHKEKKRSYLIKFKEAKKNVRADVNEIQNSLKKNLREFFKNLVSKDWNTQRKRNFQTHIAYQNCILKM